MTIHLSDERRRFIEAQLRLGRFSTETEVIDEALRLLERARPTDLERSEAVADEAARQRENLERLCETLDAMPTAEPPDELTNRDHDAILYGYRP